MNNPSFSIKPQRRSAASGDGNARVLAVRDSFVTIDTGGEAIRKNEVGFVLVGEERLMAEVLRIQGNTADMQVFEDTRGVRVGDRVALSGEMLSVVLGPGLLGQVFDGLEKPLSVLARDYGFFLPRGVDQFPLDLKKKWAFTPTVSRGDTLFAGQTIGTVQEGLFTHKIMVPFKEPEEVVVTWIKQGSFTVDTPVARIHSPDGTERDLTLFQKWPVRRPIPEFMMRNRRSEAVSPGTHDHHHPYYRHLLSHCTGWDRVHSRAFRSRENRFAESYCAVFHRGHCDCDGLWGTGRRGGGNHS